MTDQAGVNSPHLDEQGQQQAQDHAALAPLVIHEIVRAQGQQELERSFSGLAWSGLAAGLSIGFSFVRSMLLLQLLSPLQQSSGSRRSMSSSSNASVQAPSR